MIDFDSFTSDSPVPAVDPEDLERVSRFLSGHRSRSGGTVGFALEVMAQHCSSENPDVVAVMFRAGLLNLLTGHGLPEKWQEDEKLCKVVRLLAATFPIPHGVAAFDSQAFFQELDQLSK